MWVAVHVMALTGAMHQQLSLPLIEGDDSAVEPSQSHMRRMSGSASLAERRLKGMYAIFEPVSNVGFGSGFLETYEKVLRHWANGGWRYSWGGWVIEIQCHPNGRAKWNTLKITRRSPRPTPPPTPPPTPHPTHPGQIYMGGMPIEKFFMKEKLKFEIERVKLEIENRMHEYMDSMAMAFLNRVKISPDGWNDGMTVRDFNIDPKLCELAEYETVLDAEEALGVQDLDVTQNVCEIIKNPDDEVTKEHIKTLLDYFGHEHPPDMIMDILHPGEGTHVLTDENALLQQKAKAFRQRLSRVASAANFISKSLVEIGADGSDRRGSSFASTGAGAGTCSAGTGKEHCFRVRDVKMESWPDIPAEDHGKVLKGTADTKKACDEACCSHCNEIFYHTDKTCVLYGTSDMNGQGSSSASGFQPVTDSSTLGTVTEYEQVVCGGSIGERSTDGNDEVDANANLAMDVTWRGGSTLGTLAGVAAGIGDEMLNARLAFNSKKKESVAISNAQRDGTINQLGRDEATIQTDFDSLYAAQDVQSENFIARYNKQVLMMEDGYLGVEEEANTAWDMVDASVKEHIKAEEESALQQQGLFDATIELKEQNDKTWDDLETQERKMLDDGQTQFLGAVTEYADKMDKENQTSLRANADIREDNIDELIKMMEQFTVKDGDNLQELYDMQGTHDEVFTVLMDDKTEAAEQATSSLDKDREGTVLSGAAVVSGLDLIEPQMAEEEKGYESSLEAAAAAVDVTAEGARKVGEVTGEENWVTNVATKSAASEEEELAATKAQEGDVANSMKTKADQLQDTERDAENSVTNAKDGVMEKTIEVHGTSGDVHQQVLADGLTIRNRTEHDKALLSEARGAAQATMQQMQAQGVGLQHSIKNKEQELDLAVQAALQDAQAVAQRVAQWIDAAIQPQLTSESEDLTKSLNEQRKVLEDQAAKLRQRLLDIAYTLKSRSPGTGAPPDIGITEVPRMEYRMNDVREKSAALLQTLADDLKSLQNGAVGRVAMAKQVVVNQQVSTARKLRDSVKKEVNKVVQRNFDVASTQQQGVAHWTGKIKEVTDNAAGSHQYLGERLELLDPELDGVAKDLSDSASTLQGSALSLDNQGKQELLETAHKAGISLEAISRKLHEQGHENTDKILSRTMGAMATKLEREADGSEAAAALAAKLKNGHVLTLEDLKALAKEANHDAFKRSRQAQQMMTDQQALVGKAGTAAHSATLAAQQAQRQADALQRDAATTAGRAEQQADSQFGFSLGEGRRSSQLGAGLITQKGETETENTIHLMGEQEHTLADGTVITADLGALAKAGVQIDAEKLNGMANMFGMSISGLTDLVTAENDRLAEEGEGMDGKVDALTGAMTKDEKEFTEFLKQMNIDVSDLTAEEIKKLHKMKKMIDDKYMRLKNEQNEIFGGVEPMLTQSRENLHTQQQEILAIGAALQKKKSDADWWYDHIGKVTAEASTKVTADVEAEQEQLLQDKERLEEKVRASEATADGLLTAVDGDVPVAESQATQQMGALDEDIDALTVRIDAALKSPAFQVLRKLRDADRFAKKAGLEAHDKTMYLEDFAKQQEQYMAMLLTELKDAAGSVKIEEEAQSLEEEQLQERGQAKEGALLGHLVGNAKEGAVGSAGVTDLATGAINSMQSSGAATSASDAAHIAALEGRMESGVGHMHGFLTSQEEALAHLQAQFSDGGGTFAALTGELNKVLAYHSRLVDEQKAALEAKTRSITSKLFDDGEWAKGLPTMKSRNQLLPAQRRWELQEQAKKEVQTAYDNTPHASSEENSEPTETGANQTGTGSEKAVETGANQTGTGSEQAAETVSDSADGANATAPEGSGSLLETFSGLSDVELLHNAANVVGEGGESVQAQLAHSRELSAMLKAVQQHQQNLGAKVQHAIADYEQRTGHTLQAM